MAELGEDSGDMDEMDESEVEDWRKSCSRRGAARRGRELVAVGGGGGREGGRGVATPTGTHTSFSPAPTEASGGGVDASESEGG